MPGLPGLGQALERLLRHVRALGRRLLPDDRSRRLRPRTSRPSCPSTPASSTSAGGSPARTSSQQSRSRSPRRPSASTSRAGSPRRLSGERVARDTAILLALYPVSFVFTAPYSEGLFLASVGGRGAATASVAGSGSPGCSPASPSTRASSGVALDPGAAHPRAGRPPASAASSRWFRSSPCRSRRSSRSRPTTSTLSATRSPSCTPRRPGGATSATLGPLDAIWRSAQGDLPRDRDARGRAERLERLEPRDRERRSTSSCCSARSR